MTIFLDVHRLADLAESGASGQRSAVSVRQAGRRVLLVEDTQFFREVVKGHLKSAGYAVTTAENGAAGLEAFDGGQFDAVVSDIEMPVMDGWTFARELRRRPGGAQIPLLALTTLSSEADRERAAACGFDRHEVKLDRDRFLAAVAELLRSE
jgi:two-component system, chemotaxis family, sensor kinase CheA